MDIIPAVCKELGTIHLLYRCKNMDGVYTACVVMMSVCAHVFVCVCVCVCLSGFVHAVQYSRFSACTQCRMHAYVHVCVYGGRSGCVIRYVCMQYLKMNCVALTTNKRE